MRLSAKQKEILDIIYTRKGHKMWGGALEHLNNRGADRAWYVTDFSGEYGFALGFTEPQARRALNALAEMRLVDKMKWCGVNFYFLTPRCIAHARRKGFEIEAN